jgi:signal transduction histidine kinase
LLQSAIGATNRIEVVRSDRLSLALADPSQIELVILNLAINARDAMPGGGTITIGTADVTVAAPEHPEEPPPGDYIMCSVSDNGTGIPIEILDKCSTRSSRRRKSARDLASAGAWRRKAAGRGGEN